MFLFLPSAMISSFVLAGVAAPMGERIICGEASCIPPPILPN
jgi:hypothetical protein